MSRAIVLSLILFISISAHAKPLTPETVPEPLKPWVNWVLQDHVEYSCPFLYNSFAQKRCSWPSRLTLDFSANKGNFAIDWLVYQESWISLPGNKQYWPQSVIGNGKSLAVVERNGLPAVKLTPGNYHIQGIFNWDTIPESLNIPIDTGLVTLTVNGTPIDSPAINAGQLWLAGKDSGKKTAESQQNKLDVQVFRKLTDDIPMQAITRLVLNVSGEQREMKLAKPVLDGFIPLSLQSPLPARIEPNGQLLIQLRPGHWQLDVISRGEKEINTVPLTVNQPEWPASEIWALETRPDLRISEVEGLEVIDASQTNAPEEWRHLPTYKINQGESLTLKVIRRGDPEPEPNQLTINRKLWLDFNGEGYTITDNISGNMTKGWRLDALPETKLGQVTLDGNSQLITLSNSGKQGVEVRKGSIGLTADSRLEDEISTISAVGWEQNFNQVNAELNMPPGWRLLAASGVDNVPDSWIARWTLLDLFLVLIAAMITSRLFGRTWGLFTLFTLALIWHEMGAPQYSWLNILLATALIRVVPPGKFLRAIKLYRNAFWVLLVFSLLPFMVNQIRIALYPQLELPWVSFENPAVATAIAPPAAPATPEAEMAMDAAEKAVIAEEAKQAGSVSAEPSRSVLSKRDSGYAASPAKPAYDMSSDYTRFDPDAKVQTGPGLPEWQWHKVYLSWNGSVDAQQELKLWYLSPVVVKLLNFLRVVFVCLLALLMFGLVDKLPFKLKSTSPMLLWLLLIPMLALPNKPAHADIPNKELLEDLKNRLLATPDCLPNCAEIANMQVTIDDKILTINLNVHAQESVNIPLPAAYEHWWPNEIKVDNQTANSLYREGSGLWLNVAAGQHLVILRGIAPPLASFTLPLPLRPNHVSIIANGWETSGLQENGQADNQLQFNRVNLTTGKNETAKLAPGILPPFTRIERTLQLGLDWRVVTRAIRLSPPDSAISLEVPLLTRESVTTPGIHVKNGKVAVNMPAQQDEVQWESTLGKAEKIELIALETEQWIEVWKADISPIWHIEPSGIPMIHLNNTDEQWLPQWHPWPGEKLSLQITRPQALPGQTLTIDGSRLSIKPGKRSLDATLNLVLRSSQGAQHTVTLPDQAALQTVTINGQTMPLRQEGRELTLPVNPGKQDITLSWQETNEIGIVTRTPTVDLGQASVNTRLSIGLGQDRWVLFVFGPKLGPAVLFWGVLVVIILVAVGLGKVKLTPLKHWHWFLLLLGLSQVPLLAGTLVVAWLVMLGWRAKLNDNIPYFNVLQVTLALFTILSLGILLFAVEQGLLGGFPNMQIVGNQSSAFDLNWYHDRSPAQLPQATVISLPLMAYRLLMLLWSFWLAAALLNWLKWGWNCFSTNGLWHKEPEKTMPKTSNVVGNKDTPKNG